MKNKKGFTLIEIIICVSLIVVIGTASFFGIKAVNKSIRVKELKQISERALLAAEVFLETDSESYNQLYKNENGVIIPLKMLVNKGLLSLDNTDLTMEKIEDQYVITMLSGSGTGNSGCVDVRSVTSWDESMNQPIYICTKSDGSSSLTTINANEIGNVNQIGRQAHIFRGKDVTNYIKYKKADGSFTTTYRILFVESDDTLTLYSSSSFGDVFPESDLLDVEKPIRASGNTSRYAECFSKFDLLKNQQNPNYMISGTSETIRGETQIGAYDVINTMMMLATSLDITYESMPFSTWFDFNGIGVFCQTNSRTDTSKIGVICNDYYHCVGYKIHLNSKYKITGGAGTNSNPYILEKK